MNPLLLRRRGLLAAGPADPPAIVQEAHNGGSTATISVTLAATPTPGNLLILLGRNGANNAPTLDAGWTLDVRQDGNGTQSIIGHKVAGAAEPTTISVSRGASSLQGLHVLEVSGLTGAHDVSTSGQVFDKSSIALGAINPTDTPGFAVVTSSTNGSSNAHTFSDDFVAYGSTIADRQQDASKVLETLDPVSVTVGNIDTSRDTTAALAVFV